MPGTGNCTGRAPVAISRRSYPMLPPPSMVRELSPAATVSITLTAVNDIPTATAQSVSISEDSTASIFLAGIDPDGDSLTYALGSNPSSGSASLSGSTVTYTPAANYNGTDSFTFTVSDGMATSEIAEVQIAITAVNDLPVLEDITVTSSDVVYIYGSPSRCILTAEYFSLFLFC